jgi:hypothetical protein
MNPLVTLFVGIAFGIWLGFLLRSALLSFKKSIDDTKED